MAQNTRSQCSRSRLTDVGNHPLSEGEIEAYNRQLTEKERQLNEQRDAMLLQQAEFEKRQREFEESKRASLDVTDLAHMLSSIQKELVSLKSLNEQFQHLERRVDKVQTAVSATSPQKPTIDLSSNNHVTQNIAQSGLPSSDLGNPPFRTENHYSNSSIRDALELIPKYDGHNIPVLQFSRACKRAKELLPLTNENHLVRLIRNKLIGHAYLAVEDEIHDTVDQLVDCLKRIFGPARNSNYYRGQLSITYKRSSEHILDYIGRVKDLRNAIIEGDQNQFGRPLSSQELNWYLR